MAYIGPALVVAGAGSGKTRTLTAKIAHLIDQGYPPARILAITFTNKAADEMKARLVHMTGLSLDHFPWVRTYHSACFRILKRHCGLLGYQTPVQIYSDYQQQKLLKEILAKQNIDKKYFFSIQSHISKAKNSGDPEDYLPRQGRMFSFRLADVYEMYENELAARNAVDFDNILLMTRELLKRHEDVRHQYQSLFRYILVDEYQDTNNLQEELTGFLVNDGKLFCVGDDWQAIYGFRGSNVNHFLRFSQKYKGARVFRLEQNYRSAGEIVEAANHLISFNAKRMDKSCFSAQKGGIIEVHDFYSDDEEAAWVADKVRSLLGSHLAWEDMAVLYRTKFCSLPFEQAFRASGIPYRMLGAKGFFERKEILDINCYLTAAFFGKDDAAFERIVNTPRRGIGPSMLKQINRERKPGMSLQEAVRRALDENLLPEKPCSALKGLITLLDKIRVLPPKQAILEILEKVNYKEHLRQYAQSGDDFTARMENLDQLIYTASRHDTLQNYLEEASLIKEDKAEEEAVRGVALATMHASKGLEFKAVFVAGCEENLLPHWKSKDSPSELQEERRLMYVAMTRAARYLYFTSATYRKGQYNPPSRFIAEISQSPHLQLP